MNKQTIELSIPEGYEPDDGVQPRLPKVGDILMDDCFDVCEQVCEPLSKRHARKAIILRKIKPVYRKYSDFDGVVMVEIKALEDALDVIKNIKNLGRSVEHMNTVKALKELLK